MVAGLLSSVFQTILAAARRDPADTAHFPLRSRGVALIPLNICWRRGGDRAGQRKPRREMPYLSSAASLRTSLAGKFGFQYRAGFFKRLAMQVRAMAQDYLHCLVFHFPGRRLSFGIGRRLRITQVHMLVAQRGLKSAAGALDRNGPRSGRRG